jgi:hypothetical protein
VPIAYRVADGNTPDDVTHIPTWDQLHALVGSPGFLYVADSKLCSKQAMSHTACHGGRFVTVVPHGRREDTWFRQWAQTHAPAWHEAKRLPGSRLGDPDRVWRTFEAPAPSVDGYRVIWVHSSTKAARDGAARAARIEAGLAAIDAVATRLASPKTRIKTGTWSDHEGGGSGPVARSWAAASAVRRPCTTTPRPTVETQIEAQIAPFAPAVARLDEIPGVGATAAAVIIAEVGVDMSRFPTPAHLSSWARFAPGVEESAGRKKGTGSTGHGDRYLARVLGEAAVGASRTNTFLGERYRRIARRRGKKKAVVVGRSILVIVWYLLRDDAVEFHDLGPGYYDSRTNPERKKRNHIRELEALGYRVTLQPAA